MLVGNDCLQVKAVCALLDLDLLCYLLPDVRRKPRLWEDRWRSLMMLEALQRGPPTALLAAFTLLFRQCCSVALRLPNQKVGAVG